MSNQIATELNTAQDLINWIDRSEKQWSSPMDWVFRGQKLDWWKLEPSAWRSSTRLLRDGGWQVSETSREQCQSEFELARRFFLLADAQGLPIPGDCPEVRSQLQSYQDLNEFDDQNQWPTPELVWLLAIAQHYGVPTRLIDWTRKPLVAAWFAAEKAAEKWELSADKDSLRNNRFIVWALKRKSQGVDVLGEAGWKLTSAPRSSVPNLHLQSGMFTYQITESDDYEANKVTTPLCESLIQYCEDDLNDAKIETVLKAASVPWSEAGLLLTLLRDRFVQGATVYAGYEGVKRSVLEHRWRKPVTDR